MPTNDDILSKLNRLLITTPEHAFAAPPISRRTIFISFGDDSLVFGDIMPATADPIRSENPIEN